jgi:cell division septation protein DedD
MAMREGELFVEKIEVNLDGRQIFCLFCGGAVIASLVFVLGVTIGRRVEAREHPDSIAAAVAADPLAALDELAAESRAGSDLAFASTLRGEREGDPLGPVDLSLDKAPAPAARPEAVVRAQPISRPAADAEAESRAAEEAEAKLARAEAAKAEAAKAEAAKAEAAKTEAAKAEAVKAEAVKAEAVKAEAAKAEAARAQTAKAEAAAAAVEVDAGAARFTLHLISYEQRAEAEALMGRLKKAGYQPYVVESVEEGKGTWYRVRVGHYGTYEDAVAGKSDFEKKQSIIAYVTRTKR